MCIRDRTIHSPPSKPFVLETCCRVDPYNNSSLEGLYVSGGLLSTQCEAEGFRRITFHPDRPDVLSRWTVRIEASRASCPVLLSNGNAISEEELTDGRHAVTWKDPFPKPSYLFALVAGELRELRDSSTTASGRAVTLRLHVEEGAAPSTARPVFRRNGGRQVPRPGPPVTKLGRNCRMLPTGGSTKFGGRGTGPR